jgi:hypothetical protein
VGLWMGNASLPWNMKRLDRKLRLKVSTFDVTILKERFMHKMS